MSQPIGDAWLQIFSNLDIQDQLSCASAYKFFEFLLVTHTWRNKFQSFDNKKALAKLDSTTYQRFFGLNAANIETLLIGNNVGYDFGHKNLFCYAVPDNLWFFLSHSLPKLRCLRIDSVFFDDVMCTLVVSNCPNLEELEVTGSSVNAALLRQMRSLKKLYVPDSALSGQDVFNLLIDLSLTELDISGSMVGTNMLEHVGAQGLQMLRLSALALDEYLPGCVLDMAILKTLFFQFPEVGSTDNDFMDIEKWPTIFGCIGIYVVEVSLMDSQNFSLLAPVLKYMPNLKILHIDVKNVLPQLTSPPKWESLVEVHLHNGAKRRDIKQCLTDFEQLNHVYVHRLTKALLESPSRLYSDLLAQLKEVSKAEAVTIHFVGPCDPDVACRISKIKLKDPFEHLDFEQFPGLTFEFEKYEGMTQDIRTKDSYIGLQLDGA